MKRGDARAAAAGDEPIEPSDGDLVTAVRGGAEWAVETLYRRHAGVALSVARKYAHTEQDAEDFVAEAFVQVFTAIATGRGPSGQAFRSYLITAVRHNAFDRTRRQKRQTLVDDVEPLTPAEPFDDPAVRREDRELVLRAIKQLPPRWQEVLWYSEVQGLKPAAFAPLMDLTPNAAAALSLRAREGLRQAFLQAHAKSAPNDACHFTISRLAAWIRKALSRREQEVIGDHLRGCPHCTATEHQLRDLNSTMRAGAALFALRFPQHGSGSGAGPISPTGFRVGTAARRRLRALRAGTRITRSGVAVGVAASTAAAVMVTTVLGSSAPSRTMSDAERQGLPTTNIPVSPAPTAVAPPLDSAGAPRGGEGVAPRPAIAVGTTSGRRRTTRSSAAPARLANTPVLTTAAVPTRPSRSTPPTTPRPTTSAATTSPAPSTAPGSSVPPSSPPTTAPTVPPSTPPTTPPTTPPSTPDRPPLNQPTADVFVDGVVLTPLADGSVAVAVRGLRPAAGMALGCLPLSGSWGDGSQFAVLATGLGATDGESTVVRCRMGRDGVVYDIWHRYTDLGSAAIRLVLGDGAESFGWADDVVVGRSPHAPLDLRLSRAAFDGAAVTFAADGLVDVSSWTLDYGDGTYASGSGSVIPDSALTHEYSQRPRAARLTVVTADGQVFTVRAAGSVGARPILGSPTATVTPTARP